ncbi:MAG: DUF1501 domain-containing protein [Polyangiaceae bacterium]|nr:DUF1501 domain-containing protein [Polyangiaceae bacterium]
MNDSSSFLTRRQWLSAGAAGLLAGLFAQASSAEEKTAGGAPKPKAKSCIVLWMNGGPSHIDTFDPKAGPTGGSFKRIATRNRALTVTEHLPQVADIADKLAVLRGVSSKEGNHQRAIELGHTGHVPNPTVRAPSIGSWVAKHRSDAGLDIPSFVSLGGPSLGAGFFGNPYDPFVIQTPGQPPDDLAPARPVTAERDNRRRKLLDSFESEFGAQTGDSQVAARHALYEKARSMMASRNIGAFDLGAESESTLQQYGDTDFGRGCVVARRLVEVGVPFVEVTLDGWDTHQNNFDRVKGRLSILDPAMSALIKDLDTRGLLSSTLVVWMGEFGRTPRINGDDGRDHHPGAFSVVMAGAGIKPGVVHGETDAEGDAVAKDGVGVPDVVATIADRMGVDPNTEVTTPAGRPIRVTQKGKPIEALKA